MPRRITNYKKYGRFYVTKNEKERTYSFYSGDDMVNPIMTVGFDEFKETLEQLEAEEA